ncbi:MAG: transcription-repair coupling factor [Bacteroidota bacterium]|nr:transcription-repair coupling factor [Candidatus Kapabacteria bacterium]MDW8220690.1 transcription-repair coupling factor [Bacteroidota bacterium]
MKNLTSLRTVIEDCERCPSLQQILRRLTDTQEHRIDVKNAVGSLKSLIVASVWKRASALLHGHTLVLAPDEEQAEMLRDDLAMLIGSDNLIWYAGSEQKLALDAELLDTQLVGVTGALTRLLAMQNNKQRGCIIVPADALPVRVPARQILLDNLQEVRRGGRLKREELISTLTTSGFDRKDFVEVQGDVAVRGGLIDVFTPGMDYPVRIELFGDEVESIRAFDPLSQRSIKELPSVTLVTHLFHNEEHTIDATLLDYLSDTTILVQCYPEQIASTLHRASELSKTDATDNTIAAQSLIEQLMQFRTIALNALEEKPAAIFLQAKPHPAINASVAELTREMRHHAALGYTLYLMTDGLDQQQRLRDLIESAFEGKTLQDANEENVHRRLPYSDNDHSAIVQASVEQTAQQTLFVPMACSEGFVLAEARIAVLTEHQIFMRRRARMNTIARRSRGGQQSKQEFSLRELQQLHRGDYVVHVDKGIAQFDGLETISVGGVQQECVRLIFAGGDKMYVHLNYINRLQKYSAQEGQKPVLTKLGTNEWQRKKERTKKRLKDIARDLIQLYAQRKMQPGIAFPPDSLWQKEMEASFMYEDTPDQAAATRAVKDDMESPTPMDRLICGDVGFGKTEVAIRAAFKAVQAGKQVAVLVPTTILAEQHLASFRDRLERYAVVIACLSRFRTAAEQKDILRRVESGAIDILIGTHRMLSKDVKFKDLGLLVIDEEHRFGVAAKEKLRQMRVSVDTITLTATPIPRTLNFSLMGARDVSVINTPPRNRLPIKTEITVWNDAKVQAAIEREMQRGGQIFVVSDRISEIDAIAERLRCLVPSVKIIVAHGQMPPEELELRMEQFMERKADLLLATKIIESGLDIPNANTIIICNADNFGLAELYQLRGRVGRSNVQAYCYLIIPEPQTLSRTALRRLQAMEEFSELGSGFHLAMRDLEIRGAGNLLGAEQSGFIADIGFELYQKILDEAVHELKEQEFAGLFPRHYANRVQSEYDVSTHRDIELPINENMTVETDGDAMLPKHYIQSEVERYEMYKKLFRALSEEDIDTIVSEMRDRFGTLPSEAAQLIDAVRLRVAALPTGFSHVSFKHSVLTCELPSEEHTFFYTTIFPAMMKAVAQMHNIRIIPKGKKVFLQASAASLDEAQRLIRSIIDATKHVLREMSCMLEEAIDCD